MPYAQITILPQTIRWTASIMHMPVRRIQFFLIYSSIFILKKRKETSDTPRKVETVKLRERGEKEPVLRKGKRKQTHMRSFSQSNKLPLQIYPWHWLANPFIFMSKSTQQSKTYYNLTLKLHRSLSTKKVCSSSYEYVRK